MENGAPDRHASLRLAVVSALPLVVSSIPLPARLSRRPPELIIDDPPGRSDWSLDRYPQVASLLEAYQPCRIVDELCIYVRKE